MRHISVRRLLNRRILADYVNEFVDLVPDVEVAVLDNAEIVVVGAGHCIDGGPNDASGWAYREPLTVDGQGVGALVARGTGLSRDGSVQRVQFLHRSLSLILVRAAESRSLARETLERYREINLLYNIGETISASLDPDEVPDLVMAEATRVIQANGGVVLLLNDDRHLTIQSGFGAAEFGQALFDGTRELLDQALKTGDAHIWTADQLDCCESTITSVLAAPLKGREEILGFVLLGRELDRPIFSADDVKLLTALASQAAIAVENARLFADVTSQRDAIAEMKNYMDNIFASIASGVITTDTEDLITLMNRAAEDILGVPAVATMGKPYMEALAGMGSKIAPLMALIKQQNESLIGYEMEPVLPQRGPVVLRLNLSPLKDNREETNGVAIVVDDLTERRELEAQAQRIRGTFEQYVVPHIVEQLLSDPSSVRLGGARREVTTLFADIRNFTAFSEKLEPEITVDVLNRYLTLASDAILAEEGTLDKFYGDGVMALFNAPLAQSHPTLRAVRSALKIVAALDEAHAALQPENRLAFGIGITTGAAVVGSIGSQTIKNYTAVGDSVSLASRLQSHAKPRQILLNETAYRCVKDDVEARSLGMVQVKGHSEPDLVYEVLGLR